MAVAPPPPPSGLPPAAVVAALGMTCDAAAEEGFATPTSAFGEHGGGVVGAGGMVALGVSGIPGCAPSDMAFLEEAVRDPLLESWICGDPLTGGPPLGVTSGGGAVSGGAGGVDGGAPVAGGGGSSGGGSGSGSSGDRGGSGGGSTGADGSGGAPLASAPTTAAVAEAVALVDEGSLKASLAGDEDHPWFFFDEPASCGLDDADSLAPPTRDYGRLF
ncbi:hypothetical protein MMPV_010178 [Pyropia vietnamensis]